VTIDVTQIAVRVPVPGLLAGQTATVAFALSVTGPVLRASGGTLDRRKDNPYCGYEQYDFDVVTGTPAAWMSTCSRATSSAPMPPARSPGATNISMR